MIHPETEVRYINEEKGYGLFATSFIPQGTITWVRDALDREITQEELGKYPAPLAEVILQYSYRNDKGNYIFCWDNTRFINHAFQPNCCLTPYHLELAVRDISPGEELCNHYGMLNIIEPFTIPGDPGGTIYPDDLLRYSKEWDLLLKQAFFFLNTNNQPLKYLIPKQRWRMLEDVSSGKCQMQSIANCLFVDKQIEYTG